MEIQKLKRRTPLARKPHRCNFCTALAIQPGQAYIRDTLIYDGRVYDWVACCACDELVVEVWDWDGASDTGIGSDEFVEWAFAHRKNMPGAEEFLKRYYGDSYLDFLDEGE